MTSRRNPALIENERIEDNNVRHQEKKSTMNTALSLIICAFLGAVFGISVEKGRVHEPGVVKNQMLLSKFVMMKMFLSGVITGMFLLAVMSMLPVTRRHYMSAKSVFVSCNKDKGYLTVSLGGSILGAGMATAGSCPGVVLAAIGSGIHNSLYTLLGALCGAVLYGVAEPFITEIMKPSQPIKYQFLYHFYGTPYFVMALPVAAILSIAVFLLELIYPWMEENEVEQSTYDNSNWLSLPSWPPFLSGIVVGSLQVPAVFIMGDTLGASSSFCTITSQVFWPRSMRKISPYFLKFQSGLHNWWQVMFMLSSVGGAYLSSSMSGRYGNIPGTSVIQSFIGGFMILFGARLAGGCTSGHGLSGMGLLNMLSITTMAAMFVGGTVTANILQQMV